MKKHKIENQTDTKDENIWLSSKSRFLGHLKHLELKRLERHAVKLVCLSDTHNTQPSKYPEVPKGDVLVHAGDFTYQGRRREMRAFAAWVADLGFKHVVIVPGNHELSMDPRRREFDLESYDILRNIPSCQVLVDRGTQIEGKSFYGSPFTREYNNWAFSLQPGREHLHWATVPDSIDVLITHQPASGYLGCKHLRDRILETEPRIHICGHIHEEAGKEYLIGKTASYNCAILDENYVQANKPTVVEI